MAKGEGAEVRRAFDGPNVDHDTFIDFAIKQNDADRRRAASAGESRAEIKEFLDQTDLHSKAVSWMRVILKTNERDNGQAKAMDCIRSIEKLLPMVKAHVAGQGTGEMDFEGDEPDPVEPAGEDDLPPWDADPATLAGDAA